MNEILLDSFFRRLTEKEEIEFRQWVHDNYQTLKRAELGLYHPIVRDEIAKLDREIFDRAMEGD
jgi:hypothetical protein